MKLSYFPHTPSAAGGAVSAQRATNVLLVDGCCLRRRVVGRGCAGTSGKGQEGKNGDSLHKNLRR